MKFKKYISTIFSVMLAMVFLLSASGFKVYLHQCDAKHTKELSLFTENFSCDHEHHIQQAHKHIEQSGCCNSTIEPFDNEGDNCCHTSSVYYKINNEFEKSRFSAPTYFPAIICLNYNTINTETEITVELLYIDHSLSPPPIFGFDFTISLQTQKIGFIA